MRRGFKCWRSIDVEEKKKDPHSKQTLTIWRLAKRALRKNLRVRTVTGALSDILYQSFVTEAGAGNELDCPKRNCAALKLTRPSTPTNWDHEIPPQHH
jgi:hypothetical protein